jgi:site-specific DNA recombinase
VTRAAIYARFSSDNQREESITAQLRACREYCQRNGYAVVAEYTDEARSALTDDRPGFQRAIAAAEAGEYDVLVVYQLDRFARDRYDSVFYKRKLRRAGVRLESVVEHFDASPEGQVMEGIIEVFAEYFSRDLARKVLRGMKETAYQGKHCGGLPPLGYDVVDGKYVVNPWEAETVRIIYEMTAEGKGYGEIIKRLNAEGRRTKRGALFGKNSLHEILRNPKYAGLYVFNRSPRRLPDGRRTHRMHKGDGEVITLPDAIPAIVDRCLWEKVQAIMDARKRQSERARYRARVTYLLSGKVYCGECGAACVGNSYRYRDGKIYAYYECGRKDRTEGCSGRRVSKRLVEQDVLLLLKEQLLRPEDMDALARAIVEWYRRLRTDAVTELRAVEDRIRNLEAAVRNLVAAVEQGHATAALLEQLTRREAELKVLRAKAAEIARDEQNIITVEAARAYLEELAAVFAAYKEEDEESLKPLVQKCVRRVTLHREHMTVEWEIDLGCFGSGGPYVVATQRVYRCRGRGRQHDGDP